MGLCCLMLNVYGFAAMQNLHFVIQANYKPFKPQQTGNLQLVTGNCLSGEGLKRKAHSHEERVARTCSGKPDPLRSLGAPPK